MEEVLLWQFRQQCIKHICINNYSKRHAWYILLGKHLTTLRGKMSSVETEFDPPSSNN